MSDPVDPVVPVADPGAHDPGSGPGPRRPGRLGRLAGGIAGAAVLIGVVTVLARIAGFGRSLVLSHTVGQTCLGTAYTTANQVPNVVFEIVAGGALASVVVPLLSGAAERQDRTYSSRTVSALLSWTLVVTVPLVLLGLLVTGPVMGALVPDRPLGCAPGEVVALGAPMLAVFLPQIALYGVAVVLGGTLQAHRRFGAPAAMPLVSSLVVVATYLAFAVLADGRQDDLAALPSSLPFLLALGTTAGVLALALTVVLPTARLGLRLRPTLRFPPGVAHRAVRLAVAGIATLLAQQLSTVVVVRLANQVSGYLQVYTYAWALYLLPYAVLAVPLATSTFQRLAALADAGDEPGFARTTAATSRALLLACCLGAAGLAGVAQPVARVFLLGTAGRSDPGVLSATLVAFAPGVLGYGLIAHLGRVLYARGRGRAAATATVVGWLVVVAVDVVVVALVRPSAILTVLGWGNTAGMTVAGILLLVNTARAAGRTALDGLPRALIAGLVAGLTAAVAGRLAGSLGGPTEVAGSVGQAALAGVAVVVVFAALVLLLDRSDIQVLAERVVRRGRDRR